MSEPWLTVVTVVRNDADALVRTVESVASQNAPGVEQLVVDGASTDGTAAFAAGLAARYAFLRVVSQPDAGIYDAMNKGLGLARGAVVQYLNAGDIYTDPGELDWVRGRLASGPSTPWLRTRVRFVDAAGRPTRPLSSVQIDPKGFSRGRQGVFHQGAFMSLSLLRDLGGFDTRFRIAADFDLMRRALLAGVRPQVSDRVTVDVDASGVSTQHWCRSLWESHRSRSQDVGAGAVAVSWMDTCVRIAQVGTRRVMRRSAEAVVGQERVSRLRAGAETL